LFAKSKKESDDQPTSANMSRGLGALSALGKSLTSIKSTENNKPSELQPEITQDLITGRYSIKVKEAT
tara:strand:+ start:348 stop:551 length:204 start_codon:yes stop_codon:yes gene_type:complete